MGMCVNLGADLSLLAIWNEIYSTQVEDIFERLEFQREMASVMELEGW